MGKEKSQPSSGSAESSRQNKPKEGHIATQSYQSDKIKEKGQMLKVTGQK